VPTSASRRRWERVVGALLAAQLSAGLTGAVLLQPSSPSPRADAASGQVVNARTDGGSRTGAVRRLLAVRADAVLRKDRATFLTTVDPTETAFRAAQGRYVDALRAVPLASWEYALDPVRERAHTPALDARRGTWWAPNVTLRYALTGFDRAPTLQPQGLTFVQRDGRWYVAADDDFAETGRRTTRDLWDGGQVIVARGASCLVLAHPRQAGVVTTLLAECDAAVPRVDAVWGRDWARRVVVLVPDSAAELARIVPDAGDLSQIAAVATAELVEPASGYHPVGDRVLVNPATFSELGPLGRRVVITHEVTHVASRAATGPQVPTWLVEGLADYVGYLGARVRLSVAAAELRTDVRAGTVPAGLPVDGDFDGARPDLAQVYQESWLAVSLVARRYGQAALLQLYREVGADPSAGALDRAMDKVLGTTVAAFTAEWRADVLSRLS
jgi:hypothetical protein